ncbi:MAG: phosphopentomutase [Clostridia bacterium]|nr:phosphopentomutase [Clostridia bacterium]
MKRGIIIVLDAAGIGELPDASEFGDEGSNTLMHVKEANPRLNLKNMCSLGLGLIDGYNVYEKTDNPLGAYGKMIERSKGKDTTTGHWEISGIHLDKPFPTYPNGFPKEVIDRFEKAAGIGTLGNYAASGTVIIQELGDEHIKTGKPIVYTSADSVFQIAAHEDIIPVAQLYKMCETARKQLQGENGVARVIARPFTGTKGNYKRTEGRKDFSLPPTSPTLLDYMKEQGKTVACVGKIEDIFCNRGITKSVHTHTNAEGIEQTIKYIKEDFEGLIFTNLVDTDMLYGHRNDVEGFAKSLQYFDDNLPRIINAMTDEDILFITSDHGCDPTTPSTDHSREHSFLLMYGKNVKPQNLGTRKTFSDIAKTIACYVGIKGELDGENML